MKSKLKILIFKVITILGKGDTPCLNMEWAEKLWLRFFHTLSYVNYFS